MCIYTYALWWTPNMTWTTAVVMGASRKMHNNYPNLFLQFGLKLINKRNELIQISNGWNIASNGLGCPVIIMSGEGLSSDWLLQRQRHRTSCQIRKYSRNNYIILPRRHHLLILFAFYIWCGEDISSLWWWTTSTRMLSTCRAYDYSLYPLHRFIWKIRLYASFSPGLWLHY